MKKLYNKTKDIELATKVNIARSLWQRGKGLLGTKNLPLDQCLWILPCNNIHTLFMKFSIDVVFVDKNLIIKSLHENVKPWNPILLNLTAYSTFEFAVNPKRWIGTGIGDQLHVVD